MSMPFKRGDIVKATGFYARHWEDEIGIVTGGSNVVSEQEPVHVYVDLIFKPHYNLVFYPRELTLLGHYGDV